MDNPRIEALQSMLAQDPDNIFPRYGLAMEYARTGQLEEASAEFKKLLEANENYAAGYFHGGQTLEKLGRIEEAKALYERGIEVTTKSNDAHTRAELQGALDLLPI